MCLKKQMQIKIKEYSLDRFNESKFDLVYTDLEIHKYWVSEELSTYQKRTIFHFRTLMAEFSENYKQKEVVKSSQICKMHSDCQDHSVVCHETMKHVKIKRNYTEMFTNNIYH